MLLGYLQLTDSMEKNTHCLNALMHAGCEQIIEETISRQTNPVNLGQTLIRKMNAGDSLIVWKLDQLTDDFKSLVQLLLTLNKSGIHVKSLQDTMDTTSAVGRFFFYVSARFLKLPQANDRSLP